MLDNILGFSLNNNYLMNRSLKLIFLIQLSLFSYQTLSVTYKKTMLWKKFSLIIYYISHYFIGSNLLLVYDLNWSEHLKIIGNNKVFTRNFFLFIVLTLQDIESGFKENWFIVAFVCLFEPKGFSDPIVFFFPPFQTW